MYSKDPEQPASFPVDRDFNSDRKRVRLNDTFSLDAAHVYSKTKNQYQGHLNFN